MLPQTQITIPRSRFSSNLKYAGDIKILSLSDRDRSTLNVICGLPYTIGGDRGLMAELPVSSEIENLTVLTDRLECVVRIGPVVGYFHKDVESISEFRCDNPMNYPLSRLHHSPNDILINTGNAPLNVEMVSVEQWNVTNIPERKLRGNEAPLSNLPPGLLDHSNVYVLTLPVRGALLVPSAMVYCRFSTSGRVAVIRGFFSAKQSLGG